MNRKFLITYILIFTLILALFVSVSEGAVKKQILTPEAYKIVSDTIRWQPVKDSYGNIVFVESFESPSTKSIGYDNRAWLEGGTVPSAWMDPDYTSVDHGDFGTEVFWLLLEANYEHYAKYTFSTALTPCVKVSFYKDNTPTTNRDLFQLRDSSDVMAMKFLALAAGGIRTTIAATTNYTCDFSTVANDTWYSAELCLKPGDTGDDAQIKIFTDAGAQVGSTCSYNSPSKSNIEYIYLGATGFSAGEVTVLFDDIIVRDISALTIATGWIGNWTLQSLITDSDDNTFWESGYTGTPLVYSIITDPTNTTNATVDVPNADVTDDYYYTRFIVGDTLKYWDVSTGELYTGNALTLDVIGVPDSGGTGYTLLTFTGETWTTPPVAGDYLVWVDTSDLYYDFPNAGDTTDNIPKEVRLWTDAKQYTTSKTIIKPTLYKAGYYSEEFSTPSSLLETSARWEKDPVDDTTWSWADINALIGGVRKGTVTYPYQIGGKVSKIWMDVVYGKTGDAFVTHGPMFGGAQTPSVGNGILKVWYRTNEVQDTIVRYGSTEANVKAGYGGDTALSSVYTTASGTNFVAKAKLTGLTAVTTYYTDVLVKQSTGINPDIPDEARFEFDGESGTLVVGAAVTWDSTVGTGTVVYKSGTTMMVRITTWSPLDNNDTITDGTNHVDVNGTSTYWNSTYLFEGWTTLPRAKTFPVESTATDYKFIAVGDPHHVPLQHQVWESMKNKSPDFFMLLGDEYRLDYLITPYIADVREQALMRRGYHSDSYYMQENILSQTPYFRIGSDHDYGGYENTNKSGYGFWDETEVYLMTYPSYDVFVENTLFPNYDESTGAFETGYGAPAPWTGIVASGSTTTLLKTSSTVSVTGINGIYPGMVIYNTSDIGTGGNCSYGIVRNVVLGSPNEIYLTSALTGGTENDFDVGEAIRIKREGLWYYFTYGDTEFLVTDLRNKRDFNNYIGGDKVDGTAYPFADNVAANTIPKDIDNDGDRVYNEDYFHAEAGSTTTQILHAVGSLPNYTAKWDSVCAWSSAEVFRGCSLAKTITNYPGGAMAYRTTFANPTDNVSYYTPYTLVLTKPTGMVTGDLAIIAAQADKNTDTIDISQACSQTWTPVSNIVCGTSTNTQCSRIFWAEVNTATWGSCNPSVIFGNASTEPKSAVIHIFQPSNVDYTWDVDTYYTNTYAASTSVTIPSLTTNTNYDLVYALWTSTDRNTWSDTTPTTGWFSPIGSQPTQYRNARTNYQSMTDAYKLMGLADTTGTINKIQVTFGADAGTYQIVAFKESVPTSYYGIIDLEWAISGLIATDHIRFFESGASDHGCNDYSSCIDGTPDTCDCANVNFGHVQRSFLEYRLQTSIKPWKIVLSETPLFHMEAGRGDKWPDYDYNSFLVKYSNDWTAEGSYYFHTYPGKPGLIHRYLPPNPQTILYEEDAKANLVNYQQWYWDSTNSRVYVWGALGVVASATPGGQNAVFAYKQNFWDYTAIRKYMVEKYGNLNVVWIGSDRHYSAYDDHSNSADPWYHIMSGPLYPFGGHWSSRSWLWGGANAWYHRDMGADYEPEGRADNIFSFVLGDVNTNKITFNAYERDGTLISNAGSHHTEDDWVNNTDWLGNMTAIVQFQCPPNICAGCDLFGRFDSSDLNNDLDCWTEDADYLVIASQAVSNSTNNTIGIAHNTEATDPISVNQYAQVKITSTSTDGDAGVILRSPEAYIFTVTSANATAGATYTNNSCTFTVLETITGGTTLKTSCGACISASSGTLTKASGTGDATIIFSSATYKRYALVYDEGAQALKWQRYNWNTYSDQVANVVTAFLESDYSVGSQPPDWTERWNTGSGATTVETGTGIGSRQLQLAQSVNQSRYALSWNDVPTDIDITEILVKVKPSANDTFFQGRIVLRGAGTGGAETGYSFGLTNFINIEVYRTVSGTATSLATSSFSWSLGNWYWVRAKVSGTGTTVTVQMKAWLDGSSEPGSWMINYSDTNATRIVTPGWTGVASYRDTDDPYYDYFSVGLNGNSAPSPINLTNDTWMSATIQGTGATTIVKVWLRGPGLTYTTEPNYYPYSLDAWQDVNDAPTYTLHCGGTCDANGGTYAGIIIKDETGANSPTLDNFYSGDASLEGGLSKFWWRKYLYYE